MSTRVLILSASLIAIASCDVPPAESEQTPAPTVAPRISPGGRVLPDLGDISTEQVQQALGLQPGGGGGIVGRVPPSILHEGPVISNDPEWCTTYYRSCMAVCHLSLCGVIPTAFNCWICEQGCAADYDRCVEKGGAN